MNLVQSTATSYLSQTDSNIGSYQKGFTSLSVWYPSTFK
jgi:hypothetical protein